MIDIHSHVLPNMDDGPSSWDISLKQTLGKKIFRVLILYQTERDTGKNPSQGNKKSKGKDKIHYIKE